MKEQEKYNVLSPDGFTLTADDNYNSIEEAEQKTLDWCERYRVQGYYSSVSYGRIPFNEIKDYCKIITE